jgi:meiotically up-regulated gene 157 (Mug157) protein
LKYIQCDNEDEVEQILKTRGHGFCSPDHRIYSAITLSDDACNYELESEMVLALFNLQTTIEMMSGPGYECPFQEVDKAARELQQAFEKVRSLIATKPIRKKGA